MKVLVTGGAGFLGRHVAIAAAEAGHEVLIYDQAAVPNAAAVQGDLLDFHAVLDAVRQVDVTCHLGGVGDVYLAFERPALAAHANVAGTANVMEAALRAGNRRVVYASTWEVYGEPRYLPVDEDHPTNPDHPYNITKLAGEQIALAYDKLKDVPAMSLRLGTAYGTGMRSTAVMPAFIAKAAGGEPITINGDGRQARQFTHAGDIARAFVLALESEARGMAINITASTRVSIREVAETIAKRLPTPIVYSEARVGDVPTAVIANERAREILHWEPHVSFEVGLDELIDWQLEHSQSPIRPA